MIIEREKYEFESQEFKDCIQKMVSAIQIKLLEREQMIVMSMIQNNWLSGYKITQMNMATHAEWIGAHPTWDIKRILAGFTETTTRRIRDIVRTLRIEHGAPILSDFDGYYFPFSRHDAPRVLHRIEREVYHRNISSVETYREMQKVFKTQSEFIDKIDDLNNAMRDVFKPIGNSPSKKKQLTFL